MSSANNQMKDKKRKKVKNKPQKTNSNTAYQGKWLQFENMEYRDIKGDTRKWEYVKRTQDRGAVVIIARLIRSDKILLIRQFRPPIDKYIYEFPAGLIDEGESMETAAVRELMEETGYTGSIIKKTVPVYSTPGLTDETVALIFIDIDEELEINRNPVQQVEPSEDIEVVTVPLKQLNIFLDSAEREGDAVDAKLMSFAMASCFSDLLG